MHFIVECTLFVIRVMSRVLQTNVNVRGLATAS